MFRKRYIPFVILLVGTLLVPTLALAHAQLSRPDATRPLDPMPYGPTVPPEFDPMRFGPTVPPWFDPMPGLNQLDGTPEVEIIVLPGDRAPVQQISPQATPVLPRPIEPTVIPLPPTPLPVDPALPSPLQNAILESYLVEATIDGPVAEVHLTQLFRNDTNVTIEGTFIFPLPEDAAIGDFQMTVDGDVLEGQLLQRDEARGIYEEIVRQRRDPALLEYIGRDLFQASIFPIPPGATREIELTYSQILERENGLYRFVYPLRTSGYSSQPVETLAVSVELVDQPGLRTLYSPDAAIDVQRTGDDEAVAGFEATDVSPERDFEILWGTSDEAIGLNLLSHNPASDDGFFVLLAAPSLNAAADEIVARDIILVMDVSGSMEGDKIEQTRDAAKFVVDNLNPDDRFNLLQFSTSASLWSRELQPVDEESLADASDWISDLDASGSTNINLALLEALAQLDEADDADRPAYVLFLTDGLPTQGPTGTETILGNALDNEPARSVRLFTFGVGFDVNTILLDALSDELGGRSSYVTPDERIDERVGDFYSSISTPVLANVELEFDGNVTVEEIYPQPLPDLFAGEQLVIAGRYRLDDDTGGDNPGEVAIELSGTVNGERNVFTYEGEELADGSGDAFVARLWATRKIGALLTQIRRNGSDDELIDAIVELSLAYGIATPYTSYIAIEPEFAQSVPVAAAQAPGRGFATDDADFDSANSGAAVSVEVMTDTMAMTEVEETDSEGLVSASPTVVAASGEAAVRSSIQTNEMREAETVDEAADSGLRNVAGKTFQQRGTVPDADGIEQPLWIDVDYDAEEMGEIDELDQIVFGSDAYFALLNEDDFEAEWLSIGTELVIVLNDEAVRITTVE